MSFCHRVSQSATSLLIVAFAAFAASAQPLSSGVRYFVEAVDPVTSELITEVSAGDVFVLNGYVEDLTPRQENSGVFAAFLDVEYDPALISATGPISYSDFEIGTSGSLATPGLIDEVGGLTGSLTPTGPGVFTVFSSTFTALADGPLDFLLSHADKPIHHDSLIYGSDHPVPAECVVFGDQTLPASCIEELDPVVPDPYTFPTSDFDGWSLDWDADLTPSVLVHDGLEFEQLFSEVIFPREDFALPGGGILWTGSLDGLPLTQLQLFDHSAPLLNSYFAGSHHTLSQTVPEPAAGVLLLASFVAFFAVSSRDRFLKSMSVEKGVAVDVGGTHF